MKVLGLDLETTGLDFEKDRIIEIGLVLWDTELGIPLRILSEFVNEPDRPKIDKSKVAADITDEMIDLYGIRMYSKGELNVFISDISAPYFWEAEYVVAQNGNEFDKIMLKNFFSRYDWKFPEVPWIDTRVDILYPKHCVSRNLTYLAGYHGFVNPFPHRAVFDVMTMLKILNEYNIEEIVERMKSPIVTFRAIVSYDDRELTKEAGFMWNPEGKIWYKDMKECDIVEGWQSSFDFSVKQIVVRKENE